MSYYLKNTKLFVQFLFSTLVFSLCLVLSASGQGGQKKRLLTPYEALYTHFHYLTPNYYDPDQVIIPFSKFKGTKKEKLDLAIKLKAFFDAKYVFLDESQWPTDKNYIDSLHHEHRYVLHKKYPSFYLIKDHGQWLYSKKTISEIPYKFEELYPFGLSNLLQWFPSKGKPFALGMHLWQMVGIFIFFSFAIILFFFLRWVTRNLFMSILERYGVSENKRKLIRNIATPIVLSFLFYFFGLLLPLLQLPVTVLYKIVALIVRVLPVYFLAGAFWRLCNVFKVIMLVQALKTESKMDDQLVPIITKILKLLVFLIASIYILLLLDVNVLPLLAGLSLGGLALALAAQDTLKNLFASVMIFLDNPFQIGDVILSDNIAGVVEEVGFRSSLIRTYRNSLQYVPNSIIANSVIDNLGKRDKRNFRTMISITYDTPVSKIETFCEGVRQLILIQKGTNKESFNVVLNEFAASSLNIMLNVHFTTDSWNEEMAGRDLLLRNILALSEELEVRMAFPTQTIHIEDMPEKATLSPKHGTPQQVKNAMESWIEKMKKEAEAEAGVAAVEEAAEEK